MAGGVRGSGVCMEGGVHAGGGGGVHGSGRAWQEKRSLQRTVRILLE